MPPKKASAKSSQGSGVGAQAETTISALGDELLLCVFQKLSINEWWARAALLAQLLVNSARPCQHVASVAAL